jgi:hypothetical protein
MSGCQPVTFHSVTKDVFDCMRKKLEDAGFYVPPEDAGQIQGNGITANYNWDGISNLKISIIEKPLIYSCGLVIGKLTEFVNGCGGAISLKEKSCGKAGKQDDSDALSLGATQRRAEAHLLNNWDVDITNVTLTHRSGDQTDELTLASLKKNDVSVNFQIMYVTGFLANHDYWYIEFTAIGGDHPGTWKCKTNFYCDLRSSDEGTIVQIMVSAGDEDMYITESSGQCYVSLHND